jgi:hypothetical protein
MLIFRKLGLRECVPAAAPPAPAAR